MKYPSGCSTNRTYFSSSIKILVLILFANISAVQVASALDYSTYLGGVSWDEAYALAVTDTGEIVVSGITHGPSFPTTSGAYDDTYNGELDIFVMIFTTDLGELLGSTLIGGAKHDVPTDIEIDQYGSIVIVGYTLSDDFPTTQEAYDPSYNDTYRTDIFVLKILPDVSSLVASTYIGGEDFDSPSSVVVNESNEVIVAGASLSSDFPVTPGAYDTQLETTSVVVVKMSHDLTDIIAATYVGGESGGSSATDLAVDDDGSIVFCGSTYSSEYPTTPNAFDRTLNGSYCIIVSRMSQDLSELLGSTFIGGSVEDQSCQITFDQYGNIVIFGQTNSPDFPSTEGVYDSTFNDNGVYAYFDLVLFKLDSGMGNLMASTFVGSSNSNERSRSMCMDGTGEIYAVCDTYKDGFPITDDAYDGSYNGFTDVVVFSMSNDLVDLSYSTYIGGPGADIPTSVQLLGVCSIYVTGFTDGGFPITSGAYDDECGFVDGFICRFSFIDDVYSGLVTGPGPGESNPPQVRTSVAEWLAYGATGFGVNVTCGDLDGDGFDEIITGAGPGAVYGPHVRGWNSNGESLPNVSFLAYGTHKYGVNVSSGDIDGDGIDEILTGAGPGAVFGPHVRGWNVDGGAVSSMNDISYFAYGTLRWGVNVAGGDIDGDGFDEIVTGAGPGTLFGPHVRGWDYDGSGPLVPISAVSYFAYGTLQWGVNVACGDLDGDGIDEIITGPGPGVEFSPHVRGWDYSGGLLSPIPTVSYFAYSDAQYGAVVAAYDVDGDGIDEILTMPGPDPSQPAHAKAWNVDGGEVTAISEIDFYPYSDEIRYGGRIAGGRFE